MDWSSKYCLIAIVPIEVEEVHEPVDDPDDMIVLTADEVIDVDDVMDMELWE